MRISLLDSEKFGVFVCVCVCVSFTVMVAEVVVAVVAVMIVDHQLMVVLLKQLSPQRKDVFCEGLFLVLKCSRHMCVC